MSHLQKQKQILMTSHVLVMAAWEFEPPKFVRNEYGYSVEDCGRRIPALICTAPLSRALVANVFVQTRKHLQHNVVDFFLHKKVIPAFRIPVLFVYCVLMDCPGSSHDKLIGTVQRISETMPHIQTLDIEHLPDLDDREQVALATALPKSLWSLKKHSYHSIFGAHCVIRVAESCPFLQRLYLIRLEPDACAVLFSAEKNLFPNLKVLDIWTEAKSSLELYNRVFTSQVLSSRRLESFEFHCARGAEAHAAPSLKPLGHLGSISWLLAHSKLTSAPDFSVLNCCSELSDLLKVATFDGNPQQQVVVDLSGMPCLTSLGPNTLGCCKGVHTLVLPPTLRTVGRAFCAHSSVEHIDFSPCAGASLRFVDTEWFLYCAERVLTFSTLPLLGKIGSLIVGSCFLRGCSKLRHVDLSGLQGIVEIKEYFLEYTAVEELDLSALGPTCTKVGGWFLGGCRFLKKVTGCQGLCSVFNVGGGFLQDTVCLEKFDFTAMQALTELHAAQLLDGCPLQKEGKKILKGILKQNNGQQSEHCRKSQ